VRTCLSADDLKLAETMLEDKTYTHAEIAARLGVNRSTLFRHLKASREAAETPKVCLATDAEFAAVVNAFAKSESTKPLIGKRAIAETYDAGVEKGLAFGTLDEERLAEAAKQGRIQLERCDDVAGVLPKALLTRSRLRLGRDERHLIVREDL
jgi:AcrR family transcriptional regulator